MKRTISILFLAVIFFQSFSGLYVLASFYLNRAYISQNLCENRFDAVQLCKGKCYLAKELKQKEQQQQKFPDLKQKQINLFMEEDAPSSLPANSGLILSFVFVSKSSHYSGSYLSSVFHPPSVA